MRSNRAGISDNDPGRSVRFESPLLHVKMPRKRFFELGHVSTRNAAGDIVRAPHVTLYSQPWHRWVIATAYHGYDMLVWRIPGFRRFEKWQQRGKGRWYVPIGCRQDIRCHFLHAKGRDLIAVINIDDATERGIKDKLR